MKWFLTIFINNKSKMVLVADSVKSKISLRIGGGGTLVKHNGDTPDMDQIRFNKKIKQGSNE